MDDVVAARQRTLETFHDGQRSPLAAVARHDLPEGRTLVFGSAPDADVVLQGIPPQALTLRAVGDHFEADGKRLEAGARVPLGRYTLRLSHQNFPAVVVLDPQNPRLQTGPFPVWFEPDPAFRVEARLVPEPAAKDEVVLSTRGNKRRALRLGKLVFTLQGMELQLTALRLLEPGSGESDLSLFFRDATTGHESYPVGRYVDPERVAGGGFVIDFNRAYNPACAFSELYNCPIPPRENVLPVAIRAGERDPGGH